MNEALKILHKLATLIAMALFLLFATKGLLATDDHRTILLCLMCLFVIILPVTFKDL